MKTILLLIASALATPFPKGEAAFQRVKQDLLQNYYRENLTEDEIYQAAIRGLMKELDPEMAEWNRLMTPQESNEMRNDLSGEIVGAGVEIRFDEGSGQSEVLYVVPDSPAEKAGVLQGDRVLSVDGHRFEGKNLVQVVEAIRGKEGERRKLNLLRGDTVVTKSMKLTRIPFGEVKLDWPAPEVALITLNYFTEQTPAKLEKALVEAKKARSLVLDLRGNSGGGMDAAIASASLFLSKGQPIVTLKQRGKAEETIRSSREPVTTPIQIAVLIDEETKSAAEFFSMALKEQRGAVVVGKKSFGKWSLQKVEKLGNDFAIKYTIGLLRSSKGLDLAGTGVSPDLEVVMEKGQARKLQRLPEMKKRLERDNALRAAVKIVS